MKKKREFRNKPVCFRITNLWYIGKEYTLFIIGGSWKPEYPYLIGQLPYTAYKN